MVKENSLSIEKSIERGVDFLYQNQLEWGEFKTKASWNPLMIPNYFDSSPFITAFVLYSLNGIEDRKVKIITEKAIKFLLEEKEEGGIWKFWTSRNKKKLPPDLDDISVISFVLKMKGVRLEDNLSLIRQNRNEQGLFFTWLRDEKYWREISSVAKVFIKRDNVDCAVNINVLLYLGQNDRNVCSYIKRVIESEKSCSIYYPKKLSLFYAISKAFRNGISVLEGCREEILQSTLKLQKGNGSFGSDLDTALALNTLFNFNYFGKETDSAISYLLKRQSKRGFWERDYLFLGPFPYLFYGSKELTTALCLEALKNVEFKNEIGSNQNEKKSNI